MLTVALALLTAATNALSSVLQRQANTTQVARHGSGLRATAGLLVRPIWWGGMAAAVLSFVLGAAALSVGNVSAVQLLLSLELPFTLVLAARVFHERLHRDELLAVAMMTGGTVLLLACLHPTSGRPGDVGPRAWATGAGSTAAAIGLLVLLSRARGRRWAAPLLGVASGASFALTAVLLSSALADGLSRTAVGSWQTYLVPVTGVGAMLLLQLAMQAGPLVAVQPGVTLADPAVALVLGVLLFHEQVRGGWWVAPDVVAALAVVRGTLLLSRAHVTTARSEAVEQITEQPTG